MRGFWLLVHVLGFTLWLGGGIATMVAGVTAKRFAPAERLRAYQLIGAIQRLLVAPGALGVVLSGFVLAAPYMKQGAVYRPGWGMFSTRCTRNVRGSIRLRSKLSPGKYRITAAFTMSRA